MKCSQCGNKIVECDYCGTAFESNDDIICVAEGEEHLHTDCVDGWVESVHGFEEGVADDE